MGMSEARTTLNLRAGEWVEVRSAEEIFATLDEKGALDALPFMPEMLKYCGKRFSVFKRAHKTCDTIEKTGLRRMKNTVHLEGLRCDGEQHGGCQALCLMFWKEAWLKRVQAGKEEEAASRSAAETAGPIFENLMRTTRTPCEGEMAGQERYVCQVTELLKASSPLSWWDPRQFVSDLWSRNVGLTRFLRGVLIYTFNVIQHYRQGSTYPFNYAGQQTGKTPSEKIGIQAGEVVQIKSRDEILETLNKNYKNRGLWFDVEMVKFCGGKYPVIRRVEKIINEKTGQMMPIPGDCLMLDGVVCEADYHLFCPRSIYPYWREIWVKRTK